MGCTASKYVSGTIQQCGAVANDGLSDEQALKEALQRYDVVIIPPGIYHLNSVDIPDNKTILGSGERTVLQQMRRNGGNQDLRMLHIDGSNVRIEHLAVAGNLYEDRGEQNHSIFIRPINKKIRNIKVKNVKGKNIQGDLICIGSYNGKASNILIENVSADSCYRNGISITSGEDITIRRAQLRHCGLYGLCLEIDNESEETLKKVEVEHTLMSRLVIAGEKTNVIRGVSINNSYIDDHLFLNIYPRKGAPSFHPEICLLRDCESVSLKNVTFRNTRHSAVKAIKSGNDYQLKKIRMREINVENVNVKDQTLIFDMPEPIRKKIKLAKSVKNK